MTGEFANIVKNSTNYFVIATRKQLCVLPCSYNIVYQFGAKQLENGEVDSKARAINFAVRN